MLIITTQAPIEMPITLADARMQCMLDDDITDEDILIGSFIAAATDHCENFIGGALVQQQKTYYGKLYREIILSSKIISVESFSYVDTSGAVQQLAGNDFYIDRSQTLNALTPVNEWPNVNQIHPQPIIIEFTCGYGDAAAVPEGVKQAIRLLVGHWFRNRDAESASISSSVQSSVRSLLAPYRAVGV
jgi:uncharacterized phiE125 gp8 family phage protein